ncbi:hypothetical protein ACIXPW_004046 [Escherichia coli]|uniref:hypothetical protein n=1 Tax=Escherichia coli TaxID=562 RepID=UPI000DA4BDFE|nr:hypothetical protein [Escherichia coli]EEZ5727452.1 hypothetical protein [Escherichia coli O25]EKQ5579037.1 hypothetical protein [Escherichia coli]SQM40355.1 Uncharacterised protein [Escherichia coli]HAJ7037594.1 hypothetical protein [Escherichia coli]
MIKAYSILDDVYEFSDVSYYYDELSSVNFNSEVSDEVLGEDLLMISFSNGMTVDVGWYHSFEEDEEKQGEFVIYAIKNEDWESPLLRLTSGWDKSSLGQKIKQALDLSHN